MDLTWLADLGKGLPPEFRFIVILLILGIVYKAIDIKYIQPKTGAGETSEQSEALREKIGDLEFHLTNHLTTEIKELKDAIILNTKSVRDMKEEANRVANSMNVILDKNDKMRDVLIEIRGKLS